jgi:hypothetical protein
VLYLNQRYGKHPALLRRVPPTSSGGAVAGRDETRAAEGLSNQQQQQQQQQGAPVYFVYDSYHIPSADWKVVLGPPSTATDAPASASGSSAAPPPQPLSIRGTEDDGTFIGLWLDAPHGRDLSDGNFDGTTRGFLLCFCVARVCPELVVASHLVSHESSNEAVPCMPSPC